jgi:hypothetical protein
MAKRPGFVFKKLTRQLHTTSICKNHSCHLSSKGKERPKITGNVITLSGGRDNGATAAYYGAPLIQGNIIAGNAGNVCGYSAIGIFSLEDRGIQIVRNVVSASASFGISLAYSGGKTPLLARIRLLKIMEQALIFGATTRSTL